MDADKSKLRFTFHALSKDDKLPVAIVLLGFILLATIYSVVTPVFEGFDENWHYAVVQSIASGKGLPRQPADQFPHLARQEASQPPLYYLLTAAVTFWVPNNNTSIYERYNPQFVPIPWDYRDNKNIIVHTDTENFPWQGAVLAIHLARFVSVLLGTLTIYFIYLLARLLFPDNRTVALGAMILAAFTPSFIFTSALVNNDVLIACLSSATLVVLVILRERSDRRILLSGFDSTPHNKTPALQRTQCGASVLRFAQNNKLAIALGILLGLAALAKLGGLLLWLFAGLMLIWIAWKQRSASILVRYGSLIFLPAILVSCWWYVRNWMLYSDVTGLNAMLDIMGRREPGFGFADLMPELEGIRWSYWALFGQTNLLVPQWLYYAFYLCTIISIVGLAIYARRLKNSFPIIFLVIWFAIVAIALLRWALMTPGSQGRLLYPAIGAISILIARGWLEIVPRRINAIVFAALVAIALYVPFFVIKPAYAQPERLRQDQINNLISTHTNVRFGPVSFLGYRVEQETIKPGDLLWVAACWSGAEKIAEDYFVFVQLLEENDLIAAQKDTYHGLGAFPTAQWAPGAMFCDRYPLRVRDTAPSSQSNISMGLYHVSGERLRAQIDEKTIGDDFRFAGPTIATPSGQMRFDYNWGGRVALTDYKLEKTAVHAGDHLAISLTWRNLASARNDSVGTVQIMDRAGKIIGQSDKPLTIPIDEREISISPYAEPGVYEIKIGVYQPSPIDNLPLYHDGRRAQGSDLLSLWWLRVLP